MDKKTVLRKSDLIAVVAQKTGLSQEIVWEAFNAMLAEIIRGVKRGPVNIPDFGAFRTQHRCARKGRNPRTGETIDIPSSTFPVFVPGCRLKEALNKSSQR
ncbi:MAG: HU family DNA-binding protein [Candidatus Hinthialibacter sp.]